MPIRQLLAVAVVAFTAFSTESGAPRVSSRNQVLLRSYEIGYINVSVSTLWTNPSKPRPVDAPALSCPVDIQTWLSSMTVAQFQDLTTSSRTQTQALYGTRVDILEKSAGWYKITVTGQPTPSNQLGYPGWVRSCQVHTNGSTFGALQQHSPFAQVKIAPTASLYADYLLSQKLMDISYDTRLPFIERAGNIVTVGVPGGLAYLPFGSIAIYNSFADIPKPTGSDLVEAGKAAIGRPYLWGGASGFAYDCSGFTHTLYDAHGIVIPRDSGPQAYMPGYNGTMVEDRSDLEAGDLLFYADNITDAQSIYHVAMYAGDGLMLEAFGAGVPVRLTTVRFGDDYFGAKRFL